jgi:hypothetical protein
MTDEAVWSWGDETIPARIVRTRRRKFCAGFFGDRIPFVWHPSGMRNRLASRSGGIVAGAPQPPANVCDPYRGQDEASMLYPGGITQISRGLSECDTPG